MPKGPFLLSASGFLALLVVSADSFAPPVVIQSHTVCQRSGSSNAALPALSSLKMGEGGTSSTPKKKLFSWEEARKYARSFGFQSQEEWEEYGCPGAYTLPTRPDLLYEKEWEGWDDFLGVMYTFEEGRARARALNLKSKAEWDALVAKGADSWPDGRLPVGPDKIPKYKDHWQGWDDWLGPAR